MSKPDTIPITVYTIFCILFSPFTKLFKKPMYTHDPFDTASISHNSPMFAADQEGTGDANEQSQIGVLDPAEQEAPQQAVAILPEVEDSAEQKAPVIAPSAKIAAVAEEIQEASRVRKEKEANAQAIADALAIAKLNVSSYESKLVSARAAVVTAKEAELDELDEAIQILESLKESLGADLGSG